MNDTLKKVLTWFVLPVIIALLVYAIVASIMKPVNFNKERDARKEVAIQQLKDIRALEVAFKGVTGHFTADLDSLKDFYLKGQMPIVMQIGSADDSLAWAHTEAVKKAFKGKGKMTGADLLKLYEVGDKNLVFSVENKIPVKDTLPYSTSRASSTSHSPKATRSSWMPSSRWSPVSRSPCSRPRSRTSPS